MKEMISNNFKYTQKNMIIGSRMRHVVFIDKKPNDKLGQNKIANVSHKTVSIGRKKCSGCSRKRRG